jgi:hypothetical protein
VTVYLDAGVARIQRYIGRWPDLRGVRGASALVAQATSADHIEPQLAGLAKVHHETGTASGVVHLRLDGPAPVEEVAGRVASTLRRLLPAADFQIGWATGDTYADAAPAISAAINGHGDGNGIQATAPGYPFPLVMFCQLCGQGPASAVVDTPDSGENATRQACADCAARDREAGRRNDQTAAQLGANGLEAEARLVSELRPDQRWKEATAGTFAALAARSPDGKRANHLATVAIDGNRIGAFFATVADHAPSARHELSAGLAAVAFEALREATEAIDDGEGCLAVVPHLLGGDDLKVTLPALHAWPFVLAYLRAFTRRMRDETGRLLPALAGSSPTASAGVVVAHTAYPFHHTVDLAEQLLDRAKAAHAGRTPAVLWLDVTREGHTPPPTRRPWTLDELTHRGGQIAELGAMGKSARSNLARAAADDDPFLAAAAVHRTTERLGIKGAARDLASDPRLLADALDLARWWR